jgi:hypothetical protein
VAARTFALLARAFPGIDADGGFAELLKTARSVVKLDPQV